MLDETGNKAENGSGDANGALPAKAVPEGGFDPNRRRTEGYIIHCDSKTAIIAADVDPSVEFMENYWAVGQLISVWVGRNRVIGQTAKVDVPKPEWAVGDRNKVHIHIELIGEILATPDGDKFTTGISGFPQMGSIAHRIRTTDLAAIYENNSATTLTIGHLTQDRSIDAKIDFDKLLSRHFAVVGSTGVGKSTSVSLMLRKIVEARPDIRVLMLDPHNEFGSAFPNNALVVNASNLALPFWLFGLDEIAEVIFRGQDGLNTEKEFLRDFIAEAKSQHLAENDENSGSLRKQTKKTRINADTPLPYRLADLLKLIDDRLGKLDNKSEKPFLKSLKDRIETISNDARFNFMFDPVTCGGDKIGDVISKIFRVPQNGKPICVMEMSGLPSEVVSSVVSVLCRMAFDLGISSEGALQTLVVCEEAHRYIPANAADGFWPTRAAIGRIAKEGRKYGVFLGIITQRPGELDPTILSQCNTFFAMRLSNKKDQEIIAGAFNSGAQSTISFLPSISNRECIAFGEALYTPMRMTFETVQAKDLPGANIRENQDAVRAGRTVNLANVISKMRGMSKQTLDVELDELAGLAEQTFETPVAADPSSLAAHSPQQLDHPAAQSGIAVPPINPAPATERSNRPQSRPAAPAAPSGDVQASLEMAARKSIEQRYREAEKEAAEAPPIRQKNAGNELFRAFRQK